MEKQTAVEWYANASHELIVKKNNGEITNTDFLIMHHNLFYEAQKMEKEQMVTTWNVAHQAGRFEGKGIAEEGWSTWEQYYNETYGGNK